jgi:hypothetical protein
VEDGGAQRTENDGSLRARPDSERPRTASERSDWLFDPFGAALFWVAERIVHAGVAIGKMVCGKRRPR